MTSFPGLFATLRWGKVYYELSGDPSQPLVVFVHGFSQTADGWGTLVSELGGSGQRTLTFDLYGSGRSACPVVDYTLQFYVQQLEDLLDHLKLVGPFCLVGSSMGGLIASVYSHAHPEQVERLVLINPAGLPIPAAEHLKPKFLVSRLVFQLGRSRLFGELISHIGIAFVRHVLAHLADTGPDARAVPREGRAAAIGSVVARAVAAVAGVEGGLVREILYGIQNDAEGYRRAMLSTLRNINLMGDNSDLFARAGVHPRPVLVVWGKDDCVIPFACSETLTRAMPRAKVFDVPNAGHGPHACMVAGPGVARAAVRFVSAGADAAAELAAAGVLSEDDAAAALAAATAAVTQATPSTAAAVDVRSTTPGLSAQALSRRSSLAQLQQQQLQQLQELQEKHSQPGGGPDSVIDADDAVLAAAVSAVQVEADKLTQDTAATATSTAASTTVSRLVRLWENRHSLREALVWVGDLVTVHSHVVVVTTSVLAAMVTVGLTPV